MIRTWLGNEILLPSIETTLVNQRGRSSANMYELMCNEEPYCITNDVIILPMITDARIDVMHHILEIAMIRDGECFENGFSELVFLPPSFLNHFKLLANAFNVGQRQGNSYRPFLCLGRQHKFRVRETPMPTNRHKIEVLTPSLLLI